MQWPTGVSAGAPAVLIGLGSACVYAQPICPVVSADRGCSGLQRARILVCWLVFLVRQLQSDTVDAYAPTGFQGEALVAQDVSAEGMCWVTAGRR